MYSIVSVNILNISLIEPKLRTISTVKPWFYLDPYSYKYLSILRDFLSQNFKYKKICLLIL